MKFRIQKSVYISVGISLMVGIYVGTQVGGAGGSGGVNDPLAMTGHATEPELWTCSMHPQIRQPEPGDCPICGMDLILVETDTASNASARELTMSEHARSLAEIETAEVVRAFPEAEVRMVGQLDYDETRVKSLTARFPARVDRLFVNYAGVTVHKGEHLAVVYSPELLSAQRELLTAHRNDPDSAITRAAREKLRLLDLQADQIDAILSSGKASDQFELRAPISGVVISQHVREGDYVGTGQSLFRIVDLIGLWLGLEAYESDLPWLRFGQTVSFTVEAFPGETFTGTISFIHPEFNRTTHTVPVRVNVPNPDGRLKPGMFARGTVYAQLAGEGKVVVPDLAGKWISPMHPEVIKDGPGQCDVCGMDLVPAEDLGYADTADGPAALVIPASAVLQTGKRAVVYVEQEGTEQPVYEGREIVLGPRAGNQYVVASGLQAGERVVTHGAFKIDSALQIQARPSMMNPSEVGSERSHSPDGMHGEHTAAKPMPEEREPMETIDPRLIDTYLKLQSALAADSLDGARAAARDMMQVTGHTGPLAQSVHGILESDSLAGMRDPHFLDLSVRLIDFLKAHPDQISGDLLVMHCSMAMDGAGADWLQADKPLLNPYYGAMMLHCGNVKETLTESP